MTAQARVPSPRGTNSTGDGHAHVSTENGRARGSMRQARTMPRGGRGLGGGNRDEVTSGHGAAVVGGEG